MTDETKNTDGPEKVKAGRKRGPRLSTGGIDQLADALRQGRYGSFEAQSPFAATLFPLLKALGWRGTLNELFEALPHFASTLGMAELQNVLALLGYRTQERRIARLAEIDPRLFPLIFVTDASKPYVLTKDEAGGVAAFGGVEHDKVVLDDPMISGTAYVIDRSGEPTDPGRAHGGWFSAIGRRFQPVLTRLLLITFCLNMLALAVPLLTLALYDQVIPIRAGDVLVSLMVGGLLAITFDTALRMVRARLIAFAGARIEQIVGTSTFSKIIGLPPTMTESAPLGSQVAKLRDFDSLRDLFTSLLVTVALEMPFVVIFVIALFLIAGPLGFVPVGMIVIYLIIWWILAPRMRRAVLVSSRKRAERHSFLVEMISNMRTIKEAAVESVWRQRFREISAESALAHHWSTQISFLFQTLAQGVMMLSGIATLVVGVELAITGQLSLGALIAAMALTWRVLSPIQNLFLTFTRAEQTKLAIGQINSLMAMEEEPSRQKQSSGVVRAWQGGISFNRVSLRYNQHGEPALLGVSFDIEPGEFLAVSGSNGSGKSSILRLLLAMHRPQAGQITLDGVDIRQIVPSELRNAIAYVPQQPKLFYGTIAQNLRLSNPIASDEDLRKACQLSGALEAIEALPEGFNSRFGDQSLAQMNSGLQQKIALARAYVTDAPIILMDEPAHALDEPGDAALVAALENLKGDKTIIMVSHRPSHLRLADRLILMNRGTITKAGTPDEVLSTVTRGS
ncbi:peptidase domain-containing ABC transporter [Gimibacter soli]|uniref:Peptidase domain-containing ABC transporter n=1 Tax=Gimibacter soli TaxID=3024400 RepID=A0AAF0BMJ8_9PROT|nr:peptidase domain-containing ABC transporter [Gimibacter soli]WCL54660.1 peptidase domain-containing ABC transporter [Gimibacter soli]